MSIRSVSRGQIYGRFAGVGDNYSQMSGSHKASSRCLSNMSKTSQKSSKQMNASLERIHTFGMSYIHKGKFDVEKIDS